MNPRCVFLLEYPPLRVMDPEESLDFIGDVMAPHGAAKPAVPVTSPLGEVSPSSAIKILGQVLSLIISFITRAFLTIILLEREGFEILCVMFTMLLIWSLIADTTRGLWVTVDEAKAGWSAAWVMLVDFISLALVLLAFQYGSELMVEEWTLMGVSVGETIAQGFLFAIWFFPAYLYFLRVLA